MRRLAPALALAVLLAGCATGTETTAPATPPDAPGGPTAAPTAPPDTATDTPTTSPTTAPSTPSPSGDADAASFTADTRPYITQGAPVPRSPSPTCASASTPATTAWSSTSPAAGRRVGMRGTSTTRVSRALGRPRRGGRPRGPRRGPDQHGPARRHRCRRPYDGPERVRVGDTIVEVLVGSTFEGHTQVFVGVSSERPFRVQDVDGSVVARRRGRSAGAPAAPRSEVDHVSAGAAVPGLGQREHAVQRQPDGDRGQQPRTPRLLGQRLQRAGQATRLAGVVLDGGDDEKPARDQRDHRVRRVPGAPRPAYVAGARYRGWSG